MNGNKGLSKAYNKGLDFLADKDGYVLILDDDTDLGEDFFINIEKEIAKASDAALILPIVYSESVIISPCIKKGIRIVPSTDLATIEYDKISAINSGMLISLKYFEKFRYDENLFLDYIDHDFMDSFRHSGEKLVVAEKVVIRQQFFGMMVKDKKALKRRYDLFKKDFIYYAKKHGCNMFVTYLILLKRRIKTLL